MRKDAHSFYNFIDEGSEKYVKVNTCTRLCKYLAKLSYCELLLYGKDKQRNEKILALVIELEDELASYLKAESMSSYHEVISCRNAYRQLSRDDLSGCRGNHA